MLADFRNAARLGLRLEVGDHVVDLLVVRDALEDHFVARHLRLRVLQQFVEVGLVPGDARILKGPGEILAFVGAGLAPDDALQVRATPFFWKLWHALQGANAFSPAAASPASWASAETGIRNATTAPKTVERMNFLIGQARLMARRSLAQPEVDVLDNGLFRPLSQPAREAGPKLQLGLPQSHPQTGTPPPAR